MAKKWVNGEILEISPEEMQELIDRTNGKEAPPAEEGPTLESLDHRLSDVEYIITGEVVTNAQ